MSSGKVYSMEERKPAIMLHVAYEPFMKKDFALLHLFSLDMTVPYTIIREEVLNPQTLIQSPKSNILKPMKTLASIMEETHSISIDIIL